MPMSLTSNHTVPRVIILFNLDIITFDQLVGSDFWQEGKHILREILPHGNPCAYAGTSAVHQYSCGLSTFSLMPIESLVCVIL